MAEIFRTQKTTVSAGKAEKLSMRSSCNFTLKLRKIGPFGIVLFLLLFITGCNSEMANLTSIRRTPITLTTSNIGTFTKVLIYGSRAGGSEAFGTFFDSTPPVIDRELLNGEWTFYGLAYNNFSISTCAITTATVEKVRQFVNLDFSNATCGNKVFLGTDPQLNPSGATVSFSTTRLEFCESVQGITSSSDECTDDLDSVNRKQGRGHGASFRYRLMDFDKTNGVVTTNGNGFDVPCVSSTPSSGSYRGLSPTQMGFNLPAGDGATTPFLIRMKIYPASTTCSSGTPATLDLPNGIVSNTSKAKYVIQPGAPATHKLYLKMAGEEICQGDNLTSEFAGGTGTVESPRLICNANQLYGIFPAAGGAYAIYAAYKYKLLSDVDLTGVSVGAGGTYHPVWEACVDSGSNFMPIGVSSTCVVPGSPTPSPEFDGGGKTITGLKIRRPAGKIGLYGEVTNAKLRRITFKNANISGTGFVGMLAGQTYNSDIRFITSLNGSVTSTLANVGSLVGKAQGGNFKDIIISGSTINGTASVGGVVGHAIYSGASTVNINRAFVQGNIFATTDFSYVGGVVGQYGSNGVLSTLSHSRFSGVVMGHKITGGLVGSGTSLRIEHSYSNAYILSQSSSINETGGLAGNFFGRLVNGSSGIYSSFFSGSIESYCTNDDVSCLIGTITGNSNGFAAADFVSVVYPDSSEVNLTSPAFGYAQINSSFLTATPGWNDSGTNLMPFFPSSNWLFRDGYSPRLISEP